MKELDRFWENVKNEETAVLATAAQGKVTMRTVSPVYYEDCVLIFTAASSVKYLQMKENPFCCLSLGGCFMEAKADFRGPTMAQGNEALRAAYERKFHDAFDENAVFGGFHAEFVLLRPVCVKGWGMENGVFTGPFEYKAM